MSRLPRWLVVLGVVVVVLAVLPYLIPLQEGSADPVALAGDMGEFIEVDGITLYVRQTGPVDGPALLMLHGLLGTTEVWRYNREALAAAGYRVIAFDRPGGGLSDKRWDYDYSQAHQADLAWMLLDHLGVDEAVLVGHSAGAKILTQMVMRAPERVRGIVLVAGAIEEGGSPPGVDWLLNLPPVVRWMQVGLRVLLNEQRVSDLIASFQGDPSFLTQADFDVYLRGLKTPGWDIGFLALTRDSGRGQAKVSDLAGVTIPALIIHGSADTVVPPSSSRRAADVLANSTLIEYAGAGHQPMEEVAAQFNQDLIHWLNQQ